MRLECNLASSNVKIGYVMEEKLIRKLSDLEAKAFNLNTKSDAAWENENNFSINNCFKHFNKR